jgi:hypothetical protein
VRANPLTTFRLAVGTALPTADATVMAGFFSGAVGCGRASWIRSRPGTSRKTVTMSQLRTLSSRENLKNSATASRNEK